MSYTLLQLVDQMSAELGFTQPATVIGSSNNQTIQILALANRLGKDLVRDFEWQRLVQAYIWQTQNAISTTGNISGGNIIGTIVGTIAAKLVSSAGWNEEACSGEQAPWQRRNRARSELARRLATASGHAGPCSYYEIRI